MYDQLLSANDNAMRASSFFHPLVLQGEWVKNKTPEYSFSTQDKQWNSLSPSVGNSQTAEEFRALLI